jgi:glycerol-3-phosphate acyltransferase PlsY
LHFRGGAGGAPTVGGAFALWPPSLFFIVPIGFLVWYFVGYASITTMSAALVAIILFLVRASGNISPWEYVIYGVIAEILLILSLRPNIQRLIQGTERLVGYRARKRNQAK